MAEESSFQFNFSQIMQEYYNIMVMRINCYDLMKIDEELGRYVLRKIFLPLEKPIKKQIIQLKFSQKVEANQR
jgi:hypothetical protein